MLPSDSEPPQIAIHNVSPITIQFIIYNYSQVVQYI